MKLYENVKIGRFLSRPNRFIANVEVDGEIKVRHVKNTGRCRELLMSGVSVVLEKASSHGRKTEYDLVAVYKGNNLINIDSQAPNAVFGEWAEKSGYFGRLEHIKREVTYKNSRFDYYAEAEGKKIFIEIKGVTLENEGAVLFPDAPTERGIKHINELIDACQNGYTAYLFFVIQMNDCKYFAPNRETHAPFADALLKADKAGVNIRAVTCRVTADSMEIASFAEVRL